MSYNIEFYSDEDHIDISFAYCGKQLKDAKIDIRELNGKRSKDIIPTLIEAIQNIERKYDYDAPELWRAAREGLLRLYFTATLYPEHKLSVFI